MSGKIKVLIAEDSSVILNLTKKILEFQNCEIFSAKNGHVVLEMLATSDYQVILMDINMPGMDGIECTGQIRKLADPKKANVPIIAITGNARNYSLDEFKAQGFTDFLQKPLNFDVLVEKVKALA
ncbi:MAG TPA: response regulator [Catalimonadaceae bacterium]|nr:response regulator [Catalimonadaceae bacterium]HPI10549.1 response regulator [Catalimonadaceae bacterium]